jgi:hydrogenase nickel incorporation protein HypA/HybF
MHELSVCRSLLAQVERVAASHGASAVTRVRVRIGALSGIDATLLAQAFPVARAQTVAANAELDVREVGVTVRCLECGQEREAAPNRLTCPRDEDHPIRVTGGTEMLLESVELHAPEAAEDGAGPRACKDNEPKETAPCAEPADAT